jgi:hypothetical protein
MCSMHFSSQCFCSRQMKHTFYNTEHKFLCKQSTGMNFKYRINQYYKAESINSYEHSVSAFWNVFVQKLVVASFHSEQAIILRVQFVFLK